MVVERRVKLTKIIDGTKEMEKGARKNDMGRQFD
jgi:hypothetical protein